MTKLFDVDIPAEIWAVYRLRGGKPTMERLMKYKTISRLIRKAAPPRWSVKVRRYWSLDSAEAVGNKIRLTVCVDDIKSGSVTKLQQIRMTTTRELFDYK